MGSSDLLSSIWALFSCCLSLSANGVEVSHGVLDNLQSVVPSIASTKYRTGYHFQPSKNWINDPNGPMYYNGIYHLFYQYNPYGAVWGNIVWAHSVSTDLINWTPLDPALYPSKPFDINGCWTGSATILPGNKPIILYYTGNDLAKRQVQNIAVPKNLSDPFLKEWIKPDYNPVMTPINGIDASQFRDPTTAWLGPDGHWRVIMGNERNGSGVALLYRSRDFVHWVKGEHPLYSINGTGMWECPDFYPVAERGRDGLDTSVNGKGVKHVLKVSLGVGGSSFDYYTVGRYMREIDRYVPDETPSDVVIGLRYDYGKFYASKTFYDAGKNRRLLWAWILESDSQADDIAKGWAGVQCIPRAIWLDTRGKQLVQWPIKEVESLRGKQVYLHEKVLGKGDVVEIEGITASQADVDVQFDLEGLEKAEAFDPTWTNPRILCSQKGADVQGGIGPFGLLVLASNGLEEYTAVFFRVFKAQYKHVVLMCSDQSRSTLRKEVDKTTYGGFVDVVLGDGKLSLRSLIDHSIVESFGGGGRTCITARVYPTLALGDQAHLYVFNRGSETVRMSKMEAWSMRTAQLN